MNISNELRTKLLTQGAAKVGFADLRELPPEGRKGFDYGISIAAVMTPTVLKAIGSGPTPAYADEYDRLNDLLDTIGDYAVSLLESHGYRACNQRRSENGPDMETLMTALPHKTIATRAGMGWIGKCALLVTEEFGAAIRISSILTDAPVDTADPINASRCGDCNVCTEICPGQAVKGINWQLGMERDAYFDAFKCRNTAVELSARIGSKKSLCGRCILNCPRTQKYLRSQS